jgi:hypothetical protein
MSASALDSETWLEALVMVEEAVELAVSGGWLRSWARMSALGTAGGCRVGKSSEPLRRKGRGRGRGAMSTPEITPCLTASRRAVRRYHRF